MLERHSWPGNIRELRNVIERAVLVEESPWLTIANLGLPCGSGPARRLPEKADTPGRFSLLSGEKDLIVAALAEAGNNQTRAAELLGIGRFSLRYKMKKLGML